MTAQKEPSGFNLKRAALIATPFVAVGLIAAQAAQNSGEQSNREDEAEQHQAAVEARADSIRDAVNAYYDQKDIIGEVDVVQGTVPIDEAEAILRRELGEDVYNANRGRLYDYLQDSAQLTSFNPGDKLRVVQVELNNNPDDGSEYAVTDGNKDLTKSE